jgi:ubiquitin-conjugating enzyme E2 O
MYFSDGKLDKVLQHSEALIERSKANSDDEDYDLAVPRLTAGGMISLQRVLGRLKSLRSSRVG